MPPVPVTPAKAGVQLRADTTQTKDRIPAFAGMTASHYSETEIPPSTASTWPFT